MPDDQAPDPSANADPNDAPEPDDDKPLGPQGEKALESFKQRARDAEKAARQATVELEQLKRQSMSDAEKAVAQAREEGKTEALTAANERLLKAEVRAAAAGKLADPNIAVRLLDLSEFEVSTDGDVDAKAIGKALDALVKQYPALAANGGGPGNGDGGARRSANTTDMNELIRSQMRR